MNHTANRHRTNHTTGLDSLLDALTRAVNTAVAAFCGPVTVCASATGGRRKYSSRGRSRGTVYMLTPSVYHSALSGSVGSGRSYHY